jgi:transcriptional regulator with GAF, ATPase, and Fis domain
MSEYDRQARRAMPPEPKLSGAQADSDDRDVADAVRDLGGLVSGVDDIEDVLAQIASFAVAAAPGADGAGVTLIRSGGDVPSAAVVLAWSATTPFVLELDHLQYDICREGPCLTAMQTQRAQVSGSLGSDTRWSRFGGRAARLGVHSAMALPLLVRGVVVGALNIYAHERDVFTEHAVRLGEQFAVPAAVAVHNTQMLDAARDHASQLQTALTSRSTIDQAIGILRSRSGGSADEAFDRLRQVSQSENVKVSVLAQRIVDEAVRRARARRGDS